MLLSIDYIDQKNRFQSEEIEVEFNESDDTKENTINLINKILDLNKNKKIVEFIDYCFVDDEIPGGF